VWRKFIYLSNRQTTAPSSLDTPADDQGCRDVDREQELAQVRPRADGTRVPRPRRGRRPQRRGRVELQGAAAPGKGEHDRLLCLLNQFPFYHVGPYV
jgi:hypothetical protein